MNTTINHILPTLLGLFVKDTLLLLLAAIACRLLRLSSAASRHFVWSATLADVLLLPLLSMSLPKWDVSWGRAASSPSAPPDAPGSLPSASASQPVGTLSGGTLAPHTELTASDAPLRRPILARAAWAVAGLTLWLVGTLMALTHLVIGLVRVGRARRQATHLEETALHVAVAACRQLGLRRHMLFLRADGEGAVSVPVTWGALRPVVLLPPQSGAWSEDCLRAALLHELAHVQRWDWPTQLTARLACALYWWHPLVWWAARRAREEGERACDDLVLGTGMRPSDYAQRLVEVVRSMPVGTHPRTVAIALAHPSEVTARVQAILAQGGRREQVTLRRTAGLMALMAACVCSAAALTPGAATNTPRATSSDLHGEIIVIDPGHGGMDTGAVGTGGVTEKSLTLAIAQRLRMELQRRGATVFLTRDGDTFVALMSRPQLAAADHADYLISIHCDDESPQVYGATGAVVYYHDHGFFDLALAGSVGAGLGRVTGKAGRVQSDFTRFSRGGFGVLRGATMPAVLVECGNMAMPDDLARLRDPQGQQRIAEGIAAGLSAFRTSRDNGHGAGPQPLPAHTPPTPAATVMAFDQSIARDEADFLYDTRAWKKANSCLTPATVNLKRGVISDQQYRQTLNAVVEAENRRALAQAQLIYLRQKLRFLLRRLPSSRG